MLERIRRRVAFEMTFGVFLALAWAAKGIFWATVWTMDKAFTPIIWALDRIEPPTDRVFKRN